MEVIYEKGLIKDFEIRILASGKAADFLDMSFTSTETSLHTRYFSEGYEPLSGDGIMNPFIMLDILENLLKVLKSAENHFLPWYRFQLKAENVYLKIGAADCGLSDTNCGLPNTDCKPLKIRFAPLTEADSQTAKQRGFNCCFLEFLETLPAANLRCAEYAEKVKAKIKNENPARKALMNYITELKREACLCGWADKIG